MTGIETVVGAVAAGAAGGATITVGYDLFCKITKAIAGKVSARKIKKIQSEAYQELLKGDAADLTKVEAKLSQLKSKDDTSEATVRLKELHSMAVKSGRFSAKPPASKIACKKPAAKKASAKKPAAQKAAAKKPSAKKSTGRKTTTRKASGKK